MVTVGIDPHKRVHVAVAVDARGNRIGKPLTVKNDGLLIIALLTWIRSITDSTSVTWAIEDGRGFARRLADGLLLAGQEVVWVPSRLTAAHRKLHAATGSKSDAIDAMAAAHAAIATPDLTRHHIDERVRELRVLTDYRSDLVKRRTTMMNQLKAQSHLWLDHTPGDLARTKALATLTARLAAAQVGTHIRHVIAEMISELAEVNQRIHDLDAMIKELVSPLAPNLLAITGISHNSAAVLLAESVTSHGFQARPNWPATPAALQSRSTRPTKNVTAFTGEGTAASTAFSTQPPSCKNGSARPPNNSSHARSPRRAPVAPDASSNATLLM
jgi:transposase